MAEKSASGAKKNRKEWLLENLKSLGVALLVVLAIRSSLFEAYKIPSGSMIPTLLVGDHIFVNKFSYGFKVPFMEWFFENPVYVVKRDGPQRGDIVVFIYPKDESLYYIKRVVGLPGETVEIRDKVVYINGTPIERLPVSTAESQKYLSLVDADKYSVSSLTLFKEKMTSTRATVMVDSNQFYRETQGPLEVPADQYFVMGDNRDHSNDSRFWGFVPSKNIKGKAVIIWLSLWVNFGDREFSFRPSRIGKLLYE